VAGDWWCVAAALSSALFILRLETFAQQTQAAALSSVSFATGDNHGLLVCSILCTCVLMTMNADQRSDD
jgi:F0F1-type ATP synthase assembly protein I